MQTPKEISQILAKHTTIVEKSLKSMLKKQSNYEMYQYMEYFFGFASEKLKPAQVYGGKRYRSAVCMLVASCYGKTKQALPVATSIETFHNFTLIHDDIEDNDEYRRGRKTVWKLWGLNHGINTGDAQLCLANEVLAKAIETNPKTYAPINSFLATIYKQITEGQFLDFTLTDLKLGSSWVNEKNYFEMLGKKTSILVAAATKSGAMAAGRNAKEQKLWWDYGYNLGVAYQLCDDAVSIWGNSSVTGKQNYGDIIEQKKTLPILHAVGSLKGENKKKLLAIYNQEKKVTNKQAREAIALLEETTAYEYTYKKVNSYSKKSLAALEKLNISQKQKEIFRSLNNALLPNIKEIK